MTVDVKTIRHKMKLARVGNRNEKPTEDTEDESRTSSIIDLFHQLQHGIIFVINSKNPTP